MAGTIEFLQGAIKHAKKDWEQKFPAIEDVMVIHNSALVKVAPLYLAAKIDQSPNSWYVMAACDPLKGDCSRQMACTWLEDLFYEKCGCPSSYDVQAGGTMSRKVAISKELLPADNDAEYMDYYQEQMAKVKEAFAAEQKAAKKQEFIDKNGFDPDDPDIIDVTPIGEEPQALPSEGTTAVEQSAGTEVGMPKKIWYGCCFHSQGFGMKLGYDKKVWTLSQGETTVDKLGLNGNAQLTEKDEEDMIKDAEKVNEDANYYGQFAQIYSALKGIEKAIRDGNVVPSVKEAVLAECDAIKAECEKCGNPECKDGEICGLKESMDYEQTAIDVLKKIGITSHNAGSRRLTVDAPCDEESKVVAALKAAGIDAELDWDNEDGTSQYSITCPEEDQANLDDARNSAFDSLKEEFPDASDAEINTALDKAWDIGDRVANASDDEDEDLAGVWFEVACSYMPIHEAKKTQRKLKESMFSWGWQGLGAQVMAVVAKLRENGSPKFLEYADDLQAATEKQYGRDLVPELAKWGEDMNKRKVNEEE